MQNLKVKMNTGKEVVNAVHLRPHFAICNCPRQRGISLLEVLFSMFVLSVGLLGLAAMVPVGKHQVTEASHADRGTAIGLAASARAKQRTTSR